MSERQLFDGLAQAMIAKQMGDAALIEFQSANASYDWKKAEDARVRYFSAMESFFDQLSALYRVLQKS